MYVSKYYTCEEIDQRLLQGYYDDIVIAGFAGTLSEFWAFILSISNKVDKREGYDLSKNDFTDELKAKLDGIEEKANYITKVSQLENDLKFQTEDDVKKFINDLVDGADDALDTLKELAEALGNDPNFATTITNKLTDLRTKLTEEVNRAKEAEAGLGTAISHVQDNLDAAVDQLVTKVDTVRSKLLDYISRVDTKVEKNIEDIQALETKLNESTTALETELKGLIVQEKNERVDADNAITDSLNQLKSTHSADKAALEILINEEASNRSNADTALGSRIDTEIAARQADVLSLDGKINQEKTDRAAADQTILDKVSEEVTNRTTQDNLLQGNIDKEAQARIAADTVLQSNIDQEITDRTAADTVLDTKIESIKSIGEANKTQILEAIQDEVQNRKDADALLSETKVDKIEGYSLTKNDFTDILKAKLDGIEEKANYITKLSELVNDSGYQTEADVNAAIEAIIGSAPEVLDTLKEIADALGNDPNFATTITKKLAAITEQLNQEIEDRTAGDEANSNEVATEVQARKDADTALEEKLKTYVDNKSATSDTAISVLRTDLNSEIQNRKDADTAIQTALAKEVSDRETADASYTTQLNTLSQRVSDLNLSLQEAINTVKNELNEKINANTTDIATLKTQVADMSTNLTNLDQTVESKFTNVSNKVTTETQERKDADTALGSRIDALTTSLESEKTARELADTNISDKLNSEIEARKTADTTLDGKLTHLIEDETAAREAADARLESLISSNNEPFMQQVNALSQIITQERSERMDEDKALSDRIDATNQAITDEVTRATQKEDALKAEIDTLKDNSDDALTTSLATERSERIAADTSLNNKFEGMPENYVTNIGVQYAKGGEKVDIKVTTEPKSGGLSVSEVLSVNAATTTLAGVMSAADKRITNRLRILVEEGLYPYLNLISDIRYGNPIPPDPEPDPLKDTLVFSQTLINFTEDPPVRDESLTDAEWYNYLLDNGYLFPHTNPIPEATTTKNGLMSAADKAKLDGLGGNDNIDGTTVIIGGTGSLSNADGTDELELLEIKSTDSIAEAIGKVVQRIDHNEETVAAMGVDLNQKVNDVLPVHTILTAPASVENPFGDKFLPCDGTMVLASNYPQLNLGTGIMVQLPNITDPNNVLKYYIKVQ